MDKVEACEGGSELCAFGTTWGTCCKGNVKEAGGIAGSDTARPDQHKSSYAQQCQSSACCAGVALATWGVGISDLRLGVVVGPHSLGLPGSAGAV